MKWAGDGPGGPFAPSVERTVCPERVAMFDAVARGSAVGRRRTSRQPDGRRPCRGLYGSHPHLPGTSGEAQSAARRLGRIFLSESHRSLHNR